MKRRALIAAALATLVAATLAASAGADTQAGARSEAAAVSCNGTINIGNLTVLSGPAAFLGQSQQSWAELAAKRVGAQLGLKARVVGYDTTLDPAVALTAAQRLVGNRSILATIGPATSGGVAATSKTLRDASVVHVTPSATRTSLTKGGSPEATSYFYRVVADDSVQGTGQAKYAVERLNADKATVFDAQEPYSVGLANTIERALERRNVTVQRLSVTNSTTDFSSFVTRIAGDTDVVFTPFQVAANANQIAVLLKEQGKRAVVMGGDGTADPAFKVPGSYFSNFAPDLSRVPGRQAIINAWKRDNPERTLDPFGPPAYGAVQSILYAAKRACAGKRSIERINIKRKMKSGPVPNWILGGSFRYSSKTNDPLNGGFWLFQIQSDGSARQVGRL
ncbi:MAG TPA: branched-chain amino acid ABC transporter substrate-binding protein [Gaiellaceae bacterium]|jgi:branched-chain amino acid transport system substrate-binding protein|nr:branched-chain amino acid ABC transporter substrate-binding protein [Gaiellaceae bacterium]HEX4747093.1 branched-chain amino acid ABC transporter substrate-binding protein [Gaiellaceae bacterium]